MDLRFVVITKLHFNSRIGQTSHIIKLIDVKSGLVYKKEGSTADFYFTTYNLIAEENLLREYQSKDFCSTTSI
jgi:hypothetical protein